MVAFSGKVQTCDSWTGHSKYLVPRPAKRQKQGQRLRYGALYMNKQGSEYHEDFAIDDRFSLLECSTAIVADQSVDRSQSFLKGLSKQSEQFDQARASQRKRQGNRRGLPGRQRTLCEGFLRSI